MAFGFSSFARTGKTLLAKTLARYVNVPFVIADATAITQVIVTVFQITSLMSILLLTHHSFVAVLYIR